MNELEQQPDQRQSQPKHAVSKNKSIRLVLNIGIALSFLAVMYFGYGYFSKSSNPPADQQKQIQPQRIIQLDVLNGCGAKGVGSKFTDFLRTHGFDVVEMKNYKSFQIQQTLVVDRIGDLTLARKVANSLGVSEKNVLQQINTDYFVDVSVIIGKDFSQLNPSR